MRGYDRTGQRYASVDADDHQQVKAADFSRPRLALMRTRKQRLVSLPGENVRNNNVPLGDPYIVSSSAAHDLFGIGPKLLDAPDG